MDSFRTVVIEKIRIGMMQSVSAHLIDAAVDIDTLISYEADRVVFSVRGYLWGDEPVIQKTVKYPSDWRQAFKERWYPKWLLKKYPVKYTKIELVSQTLYPDYRPNLPNERHVRKWRIAEWSDCK